MSIDPKPRRTRTRNPEGSLLAAVREAQAAHRTLESAPYDGIAGSIPEWMPIAAQREFALLRDRLIQECGIEKARE